MKDDSRIERLISLAERIISALEGDIAALKSGRTAALSTNDPEIQKLTVIYNGDPDFLASTVNSAKLTRTAVAR